MSVVTTVLEHPATPSSGAISRIKCRTRMDPSGPQPNCIGRTNHPGYSSGRGCRTEPRAYVRWTTKPTGVHACSRVTRGTGRPGGRGPSLGAVALVGAVRAVLDSVAIARRVDPLVLGARER